MSAAPIRVACLQVASPDSEPAADRVRRVLAELRAVSADLVVLPELWATGYFHFGEYAAQAEPLTGPLLGALREVARERRFHLVTGSLLERAADGRLYNTSVLVDPAGEIALTYRKIHLFGHESAETRLLTPGEATPTAVTPLGRVALATCYDLRFPELFRLYADAGAELVVVVSAWPVDRLEHWRLFTRARAVENQAYLVACNATGEQAGHALAGASVVVGPWGEALAEGGPREPWVTAEIDVARPGAVRAAFPVLTHRRLRPG